MIKGKVTQAMEDIKSTKNDNKISGGGGGVGTTTGKPLSCFVSCLNLNKINNSFVIKK